ncbi:serine protease inhibitor 77Ba-like isoform X3 [Sitodiplosis mosellana]|nr:serine protease inhibitor 77Ba-like isoform X3 [Sitodiplosis mosellana]
MTMRLLVALTLALYLFGSYAVADDEYLSNNTLASIVPPMRNDSVTQEHKQKVVDSLRQLSMGNEQFSLEFLKRLSAAVSNVNYDFIVSPFSIWSLLVLTADGADGDTYSQLQQVLRLPQDLSYLRMAYKHIQKSMNVNTSTVEVALNQALFSDINRPVENEYAYKLDHIYEAEHMPVDFHNPVKTYDQINKYVSEQTHGRINKIVNMEDLREAQMILISALFFRGQWKSPFNVSQTIEEPFYDENEKFQENVNMMFQRGTFTYTGIKELDSLVLELPYGEQDQLSMIVMLPRKGVLLTSVLEKLSSFGISRVVTELRRAEAEFEEDQVEVFLPRFSITADFTLNVILEQMGLTDIFNVKKANLSGISKHPIFLSRIIHKATIDVNEVGTVATAATGAIFANKAISPRFHANRPFAFMIIEKNTNTLLFCGQVRKPGKVDFKQL